LEQSNDPIDPNIEVSTLPIQMRTISYLRIKKNEEHFIFSRYEVRLASPNSHFPNEDFYFKINFDQSRSYIKYLIGTKDQYSYITNSKVNVEMGLLGISLGKKIKEGEIQRKSVLKLFNVEPTLKASQRLVCEVEITQNAMIDDIINVNQN
jgi:uncharacterized protein YpiB (UPF0302 family)